MVYFQSYLIFIVHCNVLVDCVVIATNVFIRLTEAKSLSLCKHNCVASGDNKENSRTSQTLENRALQRLKNLYARRYETEMP